MAQIEATKAKKKKVGRKKDGSGKKTMEGECNSEY